MLKAIKIPSKVFSWSAPQQQVFFLLLGATAEMKEIPSVTEIEEILGLSKTVIVESIKKLMEKNVLHVEIDGKLNLNNWHKYNAETPETPKQEIASITATDTTSDTVIIPYPTTTAEIIEMSKCPQFAGQKPFTETEAQEFLDYYQSIDWQQRNNLKIRDWRKKIRRWNTGQKHEKHSDTWRGNKEIPATTIQDNTVISADDF